MQTKSETTDIQTMAASVASPFHSLIVIWSDAILCICMFSTTTTTTAVSAVPEALAISSALYVVTRMNSKWSKDNINGKILQLAYDEVLLTLDVYYFALILCQNPLFHQHRTPFHLCWGPTYLVLQSTHTHTHPY